MIGSKSLEIGRLTTKNNVFVAPLAGFSDVCARNIYYKLGAGLCFTEMVSAKGLLYDNANTFDLLKTGNSEYIKAAQLFGREPEVLKAACMSEYMSGFDLIDINMGCPVPKVFSNGEGSALLSDPSLCFDIVKACADAGKTVSVKMRLGIEKGSLSAKDVAAAVCDAGASMVTVHARRREDYYIGEPDPDAFNAVAEVVKKAGVPVIYNGSVFSVSDADKYMSSTAADGVMLARGALFTPWLIAELTGGAVDKKKIIKDHIEAEFAEFGEHAAVKLRKQMSFYLRSARGAKALRVRAFSATTKEELFNIVDAAF